MCKKEIYKAIIQRIALNNSELRDLRNNKEKWRQVKSDGDELPETYSCHTVVPVW